MRPGVKKKGRLIHCVRRSFLYAIPRHFFLFFGRGAVKTIEDSLTESEVHMEGQAVQPSLVILEAALEEPQRIVRFTSDLQSNPR
jgi:hypothetical protein